jgi:hypothetical protein
MQTNPWDLDCCVRDILENIGRGIDLDRDLEADHDEGTSEGRRWTEIGRDVEATTNCQTAANRSADGGGAQAASSGLLWEEQREDQSREIDLETWATSQRRIAAVRRRERRKSSWKDNAQTTEQHTKMQVGRRRASEESTKRDRKKKFDQNLQHGSCDVQNPNRALIPC